jgi:hypothetical protein
MRVSARVELQGLWWLLEPVAYCFFANLAFDDSEGKGIATCVHKQICTETYLLLGGLSSRTKTQYGSGL